MDTRQLQYIVSVAECGSITNAARKLYIAQPTLSNYIAKLEHELGVLLFDRSRTPLQPTPAGEEYIRDAKHILYLQSQLEKKMCDFSAVTRPFIRVGIPYERGSLMLPQLLPDFSHAFPQTEVQVVTASGHRLRELLTDGQLDFYILPVMEKENDLCYSLIYREELLLCAGVGIITDAHRLPGRMDVVDIAKCAGLPFVCVEAGHAISDTVDTLLPQTGKGRNVAFTAYGVSQALRMAAAGVGVAVVPRMTLDLTRYDPSAELYSIGDPPMYWNVCAVYRRDTYLGRAERALIELAAERFAPYTAMLEEKQETSKINQKTN